MIFSSRKKMPWSTCMSLAQVDMGLGCPHPFSHEIAQYLIAFFLTEQGERSGSIWQQQLLNSWNMREINWIRFYILQFVPAQCQIWGKKTLRKKTYTYISLMFSRVSYIYIYIHTYTHLNTESFNRHVHFLSPLRKHAYLKILKILPPKNEKKKKNQIKL